MTTIEDQARSLFLAAVERGPDQWPAFLDEACGGDAGVRARVEDLLRAHQAMGTIHAGRGGGRAATVDLGLAEQPGTVIGPYKLMEQIGEGGFGVVFLAEQTQPVRRKVALKVLKAGMDTRQVVARFEAERQALALMDHPNIAKVFDGGATASGRPYFVMELVKGVPITEFCDQNRLAPRQRLELFLSVCQAVQHAHQKGIIHRDLKPANVLVSRHDTTPVVKVIDFGVAKAIGQQLTDKTLFTGVAQMVGTPLYMSPEQAGLSDLDVDTRSDIYSLGVLLYELLTGTTPFDRERLGKAGYDEVRRIIREEEPARPSTRINTLGLAAKTVSANRQSDPKRLRQLFRGELDWIVMKALEKDRTRRYEAATGFARDVQRYLADEPVLACPPSAGYRLRKFVKRNKARLLAAAGALVLLLVVAVGVPVNAVLRLERDAAVANQERAERAEERTRGLLDELRKAQKEIKVRSHLSQARAYRRSGQMGQRLKCLEELTAAARLDPSPELRPELRDEAITAMALPDVRLGPAWHAFPDGYKGWTYDDQYRSYARGDEKGVISIRSLPDDREIRTIVSDPVKPAVQLMLSPDGRYLATLAGDRSLKVFRVSDGEAVLRETPRHTCAWAFSPDSQQLAIGEQGWVRRFDLTTGQERNCWKLPGACPPYYLRFHPDNRRLAVGYVNSDFVSVHDATTGELVAKLPVGATHEQVVAWHPDGECLAVAGSERIQIWNVAVARKLATLEAHVQQVTQLSFHPDGSLLASTSWDGALRLWEPATGRPLMQLPMSGWTWFSSDGRVVGIAGHGEQAQLLEVTPSGEYRTLVSSLGAGQGGYNQASDISPDGRLLALGMEDAVRLFHLASGRELAVLPAGRPLFQSDSELLIAGPGGLQRWPIQPGAAANELRLGPERSIALPEVPHGAERSQDGRTLAILSEAGGTGLLMDLASDSVRAPRFSHARASYVALSRDGHWLATSGWHSDRVRLWNAQTGQMVNEWVLAGHTQVFFTPDSRALIISRGDEFCFYDVQTLERIRWIRRDVAQYPGEVAFSSDGGLMALEMAPGIVHLKDAATGRTVARLEDPNDDRARWMSFTPDGTQLVVTAAYASAVHVWDLRAIRRRLKGMGLDWDWPEFPPAAAADEPGQKYAEPAWKAQVIESEAMRASTLNRQANALRAEGKLDEAINCYRKAIGLKPDYVQAWSGRGVAHAGLGQWDKAAADFEKTTQLAPDDVQTWYFVALLRLHLGDDDGYRKACAGMLERFGQSSDLNAARWTSWACTLAPDATADWGPVITLAEKRLAAHPKNCDCLQNLGAVLYRAGRFDEAAKRLTEAHDAYPETANPTGSLIYTWLFQAMTQHRLGHGDEARRWLDKAVKDIDQPPPGRPQDGEAGPWNRRLTLHLLRREAEELLKK
jgi:serine/threonine protein kinase/WD40 repeat protein/Tfp pilus assembly protein PilF